MIGPSDAAGLRRIRELHTAAVVEYNAGRPARSKQILRQALGQLAAGDVGDEQDRALLSARIWISLALSESELRGPDAALDALARADELAETTGDLNVRALALCQRGAIALRVGRLGPALEHYVAALELIEHTDPHDHFIILLNAGTLYLFQGDLARARPTLARAADYARTQDLGVGEFKAEHNLGYAEFMAGNLPEALNRMEQANRIQGDMPRGIPLLDRARVLVETGLAREADDVLAQAAEIFGTDRLAQDLAEVELARAECALLSGDTSAARRFAARARDRFRRRGNDRWRRTAELALLQADLAGGRSPKRLVPVALRLASELRTEGLATKARTAALVASEALLADGRPDEAEAVAAEGAKRSDPITARLHDRYLRSQLDLARGDPRAAQRHARAGLADLARYQASFGGIDLRTASAIHGRRLADLDIAIAVEQGNATAVLAAVERGRAVSSRLPPVRPPADERSAHLLAELRQTVETIRSAPSDASELQHRRRELERQIKSRSWTIAGGGEVQRPAGAPAIRAALAEADATLAVYVQVRGQLVAVVAGSRRTRLIELADALDVDALVRRARADLDVLAYERLPAGLRTAAAGSLARALGSLDALLVVPLAAADSRLVVVPTGTLGTLPWTSLPSRRGAPVVVAPSATAWLAARGRVSTNVGVAALAGPDLVRAAQEVADIAAAWPNADSATMASRDELMKAMSSAAIVHVAAHGQHQTENPLFSSIGLADGPLFAHELEHAAPHVILSACELGLATVRPGDEALGLTSVLLHLGAQTVVSGVARVGDAAAAEAMVRYHRGLAAGADPAQALASAVADVDQPTPFVCFGA